TAGVVDDRYFEQLGDVEELEALVGVGLHGGDALVEHLDAEGAGRGDRVGARADRLLGADVVDAPAAALLEEDHAAAGAAAVAAAAITRHLDKFQAGDRAQQIARL